MLTAKCSRYPSPDAGGSSAPRLRDRLPRVSKEDGDNMQTLTHVQRQLVQKSFQTHAFEAKIKAKDAEEQATTATEVLQQALRIHAASVASLNVDGLPPADDYRHRLPRKSLGRLQYEDLGRMPTMTEHHTNDARCPLDAADSPRPTFQKQVEPRRQPEVAAPQTNQHPAEGGGDCRSIAARSTGGGDTAEADGDDGGGGGGSGDGGGWVGDTGGGGSSSGNGNEDLDDTGGNGAGLVGNADPGLSCALLLPSPSPSPTGFPRAGSFKRRVGVSPVPLASSSLGSRAPAVSSPRNIKSRTFQSVALSSTSGSSGSGDGGGGLGGKRRSVGPPTGSGCVALPMDMELAATSETECGGALARSDSGLRRVDQMLQALRGLHGSAATAGGDGGPAALPQISRPPAHVRPPPSATGQPAASASGKATVTVFNLGALGTGGKHPRRQLAGAHAPAGGSRNQSPGTSGEHGPYASYMPRHLMQAAAAAPSAQDSLSGRTGSITASCTPSYRPQQYPHPPPRSRSPQYGRPGTRASWNPRASGGSAASQSLAPELSALLLPQQQRSTQDGGELAVGRNGSIVSFTSAWRPTPAPPQAEPSCTGDAADGGTGCLSRQASLRAMASSNGRDVAPGPTVCNIRRRSATEEGGEGSPRFRTGSGGPPPSTGMQPPVATEQLFMRISRSAARQGAQQQWVPVFEGSLPTASGFTAASCGASPYAAQGLSASIDMADAGWDAVAAAAAAVGYGRRSSPPLTQQPPSGALHQAKTMPEAAVNLGVRLPPIADGSTASTALPATGAVDGSASEPRSCSSRKNRLRPSLSWSAPAVEGGAAAGTVTQRPGPGPTPSADSETPFAGNGPLASNEPSTGRTAAAAGGLPSGVASRERSVSTDGVIRRCHAAAAAGAAGRRVPVGADRAAAGVRGPSGDLMSGGGPVTPRGRHRRKKRTPAGPGLGTRAGAGGVGGGSHGGIDGGGGEAHGSPSIMTRMRQALDNLLGRSPPPRCGVASAAYDRGALCQSVCDG